MTLDTLSKENIEKLLEINEFFGHAIRPMRIPDREVVGREDSLKELSLELERPETPVALLIAPAGGGKTSLVETWNKREREKGHNVYTFVTDIGALGSEGLNGRDRNAVLQGRLEQLLPKMKQVEDIIRTEEPDAEVILFVDEFHLVISTFGAGTKIGGDIMKTALTPPPIKFIGATTTGEFETYIEPDDAFTRRLNLLRLPPLDDDLVVDIIENVAETWAKNDRQPFTTDQFEHTDRSVYEYIVKMRKLHLQQYGEPAKSIDLLESCVSEVVYQNAEAITPETVEKVFKARHQIDLNANFMYKHVMEVLKRRVKGQPLMLETIKKGIFKMMYPIEYSNRPRMALLFVGTTGTGKTETAKALAEGLFGSEDALHTFSMTDYSAAKSEERFRREFGSAVAAYPSSVILLDEIEKGHESVLLSLLPILDEGSVKYEQLGADGFEVSRTVSLRNTIVIATSNAGSETIAKVTEFHREKDDPYTVNEMTDEDLLEWEHEKSTVQGALLSDKKIRPELIGRFQQIIPFGKLQKRTKLSIINHKLDYYYQRMEELYGVKIIAPPKQNGASGTGYEEWQENPIAMYILLDKGSGDGANDGGARKINRDLEDNVLTVLQEAMAENEHRDVHVFDIKTNGLTLFESGQAYEEGKIIVEPHVTVREKVEPKQRKRKRQSFVHVSS